MRRRTLFAGLLAVAALSSVPGRAEAFCRTTTAAAATQTCTTDGLPLFWRNACRGIHLDPSPLSATDKPTYIDTLNTALAQWSQATCPDGSGKASITISYLGETTDDYVGYRDGGPNENAIFFRTQAWEYADGNQVALTTVTFRSDTGDILDADMEVNSTLDITTERPLPARGFDLETVFAHELGHVLGLAHSDQRTATMYATYNPGTTDQGSLEDDDRDGLCAIYLPNGKRAAGAQGDLAADACDPDAEALTTSSSGDSGGCGCHTPGSVPAGGSAALGLGSLLALVAARRTRRH